MCINLGDSHVNALSHRRPGVVGGVPVVRADSDHARSEPEFRMRDRSIRVGEGALCLEAERPTEPCNGCRGVLVAKYGKNVWCHAHRVTGAGHASLGRMLRFGREATVRPEGADELSRGDPGKEAEVSIEMRLIVVTAIKGHVAQSSWLLSLERLDRAVEAQDSREHLWRETDVLAELFGEAAATPTERCRQRSDRHLATAVDDAAPCPDHFSGDGTS